MNRKIDIGDDGEFDFSQFMNDFSLQDKKDEFNQKSNNFEIGKDIKDILFSYQEKHLRNLVTIFRKKNIAIDGSDTGTGKTFIASALAKFFNVQPFIICPKSMISSWNNVIKKFNIKPLAIVNYETIKLGKYYKDNNYLQRVTCPYIDIYENESNKKIFKWNLPSKCILIFDEAHLCRKSSSQNTQLLLASKNIDCKKLLLSATLSDSVENFSIFGYMLNLYNNMLKVNKWINSLETVNVLPEIHKKIYPFNGARMKISELGDSFPKNQVCVETFEMENSSFIQKEYAEIDKAIQLLKNDENQNALTNITRARQKIEILKISTFIELTKQYRENNFSVVIFLNFKKTLFTLAKYLNTDCLIHGEQTSYQRDINLKNFINNKEKIIICNIKAGGVGISLDDKFGDNPRISLISPTWSSTDLKQCLGRIYRADTKTPALQRIICCSNTIEEKICDKLNIKMSNIDSINDGDLKI